MDILDIVLNFIQHGILHLSIGKMLVYVLIATHITIAGVTIFLHRCQAHRSLDLHAIPSHFFRMWLWLTTGMVTKQWVAIHRKHHAKCETEQDPHSPQTRGIMKVLLQGAELYKVEAKNQETISKYGHGTPDDWMEKNVYSKFSWQGVAISLILNVILFGAFGLTIWAIQMAWIPFLAAGVINGLGHYFGYRSFDAPDASVNLIPWGILIGGEELHNNHHTYPTSARLSNKWYEFDIGWLYIKILAFFKLATIKKIAPVAKFNTKDTSIVNEGTLTALIHHRYDAMARYKSILLNMCKHELGANASSIIALLLSDAVKLSDQQKAELNNTLAGHKAIKFAYDMRQDLLSLWERSHQTSEQLLVSLESWCKKAETSGLPSLVNFSMLLKRYCV
jgi:stearoyl-CoA desaturase (Delta-9 desaturase)